jgi:predicted metal-binding membrane protein
VDQPKATVPQAHERHVILALLLGFAAAAWLLLAWQSAGMNGEMTPTMGMGAALFLGNWVLMMVAIMFPTAAPMILTFTRIHQNKRELNQAFVPTWIFAGGYLAVWAVVGALAFGLAVGLEYLGQQSEWLMANATHIGGGLLMVAGIYQFLPIKNVCLSKCRTPMSFVLTSWRDGYGGSFRMGIQHGAYCLGCCWLLFLILFPLGVMNVAAMAIITAVIFLEKSTPIGPRIAQVAGAALVLYGVLVQFLPNLLPTAMSS